MTRLAKFVLVCLLSGCASQVFAASLFEDNFPLELELTGPLWSLMESKEESSEWPFRLGTDGFELDIQIKARGKSRLRICEFPPLKITFKNTDTAGTLFAGQEKLKLVTRCKKTERAGIDVLEEYAAYRIFSLLSDVSHRVRLVHMTYNDTDGRLNKTYSDSYAFLIEPLDQLVSRVNGSLSGLNAVSLGQINENQAALVYVFQYLIANTDWSFVSPDDDEVCCHNIELIKIGPKQFPVPYDFDLAGMVNASYARPDPSLKIRNVSIRKYRGFCTDTEILRNALISISAKEAEVMNIIANLPALSDQEKSKQSDYLGKFFRQADAQEALISSFERSCHP